MMRGTFLTFTWLCVWIWLMLCHQIQENLKLRSCQTVPSRSKRGVVWGREACCRQILWYCSGKNRFTLHALGEYTRNLQKQYNYNISIVPMLYMYIIAPDFPPTFLSSFFYPENNFISIQANYDLFVRCLVPHHLLHSILYCKGQGTRLYCIISSISWYWDCVL